MEVCRALKEGKPVLVGHFQEEGSFGGLTIAVAGDHYQFLSPAGFQLNAPVPNTESHITSLVAAATPTVLKVDWVFDPAFCENCDGTWCISCSEDGTCDIGQLFDDSWLKLNRGLDCNSI
jgi:FlaG/FlaF family flagellin (archaellin)